MASVRLLPGILAALFTGILLNSATAGAHADLLRSSPISDTVLSAVPKEITFSFSEPVVVESSQVRLIDATGTQYDQGDFHHHGDATNPGLTVKPGLTPGVYTVQWDVVSVADGHPTSGSFSFEVVVPSDPTPEVSIGVEDDSSNDSSPTPIILIIAAVLAVSAVIGFGVWRTRRRK